MLPHAESLTRDNFSKGRQYRRAGAGRQLARLANRVMLLAGPEGSGKSHLTAIWAEQAGARSTSGMR